MHVEIPDEMWTTRCKQSNLLLTSYCLLAIATRMANMSVCRDVYLMSVYMFLLLCYINSLGAQSGRYQWGSDV